MRVVIVNYSYIYLIKKDINNSYYFSTSGKHSSKKKKTNIFHDLGKKMWWPCLFVEKLYSTVVYSIICSGEIHLKQVRSSSGWERVEYANSDFTCHYSRHHQKMCGFIFHAPTTSNTVLKIIKNKLRVLQIQSLIEAPIRRAGKSWYDQQEPKASLKHLHDVQPSEWLWTCRKQWDEGICTTRGLPPGFTEAGNMGMCTLTHTYHSFTACRRSSLQETPVMRVNSALKSKHTII